ncbi:HlyD family efflux transporter periplasmic adaptor subunit [Moorena producens JHB]|uniref:HlyD family efflux transporter periplasmic adaptor subunit n=1 Tax=Moorena producens (strain JHB) TaxID=1454205 RepID=A0A1D9FUR8_MOOP1|nr:HlyD family efflux transporter periplasmic adaptor subunit [Moorena producens]AOY78900.1 HlyD family efflux transporter periplasmic adaptor subunit [Moorena producens JHB]
MPNTLNGHLNGHRPTQLQDTNHDQDSLNSANIAKFTDDWSYATKELLDSLPQVWTRGLLYFIVVFVSVILPWSMVYKVDETGTARGRLEPKGKTVRLDAAVAGTVDEIKVKEGEKVEAGQNLVILKSGLVRTELQQVNDKLKGQLSRRSQLELLKNQLVVVLTTQEQQNQAQALEKQAQIDQARQTITDLRNSYNLQKEEKLAQVNQAKQNLELSKTASKLLEIRLANAQREVQRYRKLWQQGVVPEIDVLDKDDVVQERRRLYEQTKSDIEQAKLRIREEQSSYERTMRQAQADIEQAKLRLKEQERSYQSLIHSGKLSVLKIEEQLNNIETQITTLNSEIAQSKRQIDSLQLQLKQRVLDAPVSGMVFQLPIQRPGAVVQQGTMVAEIAPEDSSLIIRAQMATSESGSLKKGMPVKLKFDAYPFQEYGVMAGELVEISPTTSEVETRDGKVAAYNIEIALNQDCIPTGKECIGFRPGDTATAEVILRQRRIIDFILDPFKKLQQGGLKL